MTTTDAAGSLSGRLAGQGALLFAGFAGAQVCSFLRNALLGHWLAKGDFGIAATLTLTLTLIEILSDLGAGLIGGMGFAPSADIGESHAVFQPCHGSAPDIYGRNIANPVGMIWSAALMLEFLGEQQPACGVAAQELVRAIEQVLEHGPRTPDLGGTANTTEMGKAIAALLDRG